MDHWSEKYFWELGKSYSYAELGDNFRIFELFDYRVRRDAVIQLLENGMEEFNLRRNPIILPKETTMEVPKSCLKSIIFINIDISSTQIKTVFTYLDIGRKIGQKQNFECNMQPLNNFIKQSELYRRPILQMPNRLKLGLEKIFGDHLKIYSNYKRQKEKLESDVGKNWQAHNIWYAVSIKKNQLDTVFGSIKNLEKSFFASGILEKNDELRKAKFCTRGEEILPAIQHKYPYLDFRLKSHFVVAQISSKHLQLSLHQVVKLASPGKDPASIIIQDEMIHIDDGYDTLYITLKILQLENSTSPVPDKYALLHGDTHGVTYKIESLALSYDYISTFVVEYEQIQNSLSIKVSSDFKGDIDDYINYTYYATLKFTDPLTLAYI
ncbi:hypothetical protein INT47_000360 [Mucor saturninus]|uniref:Uncharacterized protein n=1 Tax=Mucor saturninus TaxID=64648 RepID=A0A8H7QY75_9FUNG|nr:hypothetical protein INT47_000360 [Mucor saturninus]